MGRRNESPEKKRRRELIGKFLKENPINDPNDINELVKELIAQVVENGLEGELDEELGTPNTTIKTKKQTIAGFWCKNHLSLSQLS